MQTRRSRVQKRFQEGSIHLLEQPIIKDTRLELADRLRLEEIQMLGLQEARLFEDFARSAMQVAAQNHDAQTAPE